MSKVLATLKAAFWFGGYVLLPGVAVIVSSLFLTGCVSMGETTRREPIELWKDMVRQEKFKPQSGVDFDTTWRTINPNDRSLRDVFPDGRSNRRPVEGTIARGHLKYNDAFATGFAAPNVYTGANPVKLTAQVLEHGQAKYTVYCAPCHDQSGGGQGIVNAKEPTYKPGNLHEDRIKQMADGEIFWVLTHGRRTMPAYRFQLNETDRWSVVYYVRALQRGTSGTAADLPEAERARLVK